MAGLMLQKEKKTESWSRIQQSVETPRSPSMAVRSLAGPTSRRSCRRADLKEASINNVQYLRIPSRILKGASNEEVVDDVVAEVSTMKLGKVMLLSNVWSVETSRYPA
jgi:hypothetical protein